MTVQLRSADPAPSAIDPHSSEADSMLTDILSTPRVAPNHQRRRVIGLGLATAAAAAVVAVPAFWPGDNAPSSAQAFSVTKHADGSVEVHVDADEFDDPAALQQALRDQGLRAYVEKDEPVTSGGGYTIDGDKVPAGCRLYPNTPIERNEFLRLEKAMYGPHGAIKLGDELGEMTLRPAKLPNDGAFYLTAYVVGGELLSFGPNIITCSN